jgi:hypothetical protein
VDGQFIDPHIDYFLVNVHAQQPPDKKEGDYGDNNVANPLACGPGFRLLCHLVDSSSYVRLWFLGQDISKQYF